MEEILLNINYQSELDKCVQFLEKFSIAHILQHLQIEDDYSKNQLVKGEIIQDALASGGKLKYMKMLNEVAKGERTNVVIDLDDIFTMEELGQDFGNNIMKNTYHYIDLFSQAIDSLMPPLDANRLATSNSPINAIIGQRLLRQQTRTATSGSLPFPIISEDTEYPPSLLRQYSVYFNPPAKQKALAVRQVKSSHIGSLIKLRGVVTRISEVKPQVSICTYTCDKCGHEIYQEVTTSAFTPLLECPTQVCRANNSHGELFMETRGSKFIKYQELKLQELTDQVPMGHIPRSLTVHAYEDLTRKVSPGEQVIISGVFLPRPYTGFQAVRAGLLTDTYLLAMDVEHLKQKYDELVLADNAITSASLQQIFTLSGEPNVYDKLARSLAPEIYGHEDVKKALLLMMAGGVTRITEDGMKIRGDINICLMGDPGVAKSQLLKYIARIAPRGVYTTGKGSSGVGLTAAVTKDPITNEMVLEGGALVLADNGICCIDEFDKMDDYDRTAIHEVMEQQTISIAKAGITTTLNARTSILAAANPLHGRYNPKRSPKENINLPYALLSRFDILFLILDRPDMEEDTRLADHVLYVHKTGTSPSLQTDVVSPDVLRQYIAHARQYQPYLPKYLVDYVTGAYVSLRTSDLLGKDFYTTPRTLMAIIRMSQALARLRFSNEVAQADIDEAMRLLDASRASIFIPYGKGNSSSASLLDPMTRIYTLIRDMPASSSFGNGNGGTAKEVLMDAIREKVRVSGFTEAQLQECISLFDSASVWSLSSDERRLIIYN